MFSHIKMTQILGYNIKFKFLNLRLPINTFKLNYHVHHFGPCRPKVDGRNYNSIAAYKYAEKDDFRTAGNNGRVNLSPKLESDSQSIEAALSDIDWTVKRTGRIMVTHVIKALNMINGREINASIHSLYLLRCCKYLLSEPPSKRTELVNQIWTRSQELGITFDVRHYNALLDVHIRNDFSFNPSEILNSMEGKHIDPNKTTCLLLIKKYCKDGNLGGASEILEYMKDKGFPANEEVFNYLIEGHLKNNDFTGAKDMIEVMHAANLSPSEDTYALFASAYAICGDKSQMMQYLNGENTNGVFLSNKNYLKVIEALSASGNDQDIEEVLSLMGNVENYRAELINSAIELIHKGHIETAYKLIKSSATSDFQHGTNIFIKQLIKIEAPTSQILHYCNDILNQGTNELILYNGAKAAIGYGKIECAFTLFKERLMQGHPIRVSHFLPIFSHLQQTKSTEKIWEVLKKMCEIGIPADFMLYLDHIFPAMGVPKIADVVENVQKCGQVMQPAYDALFTYYCNLGEMDLALSLIQTVPIGISPKLDFKGLLNKYNEFSGENISGKYLKVLKYVLENIALLGKQDNTDVIRGEYLAQLILRKPSLYETLLRREGISFSQKSFNVCQEILNEKNPASLLFLDKLKVNRSENMFVMTVEEENSHLNYLESQKLSCRTFLMERIMHHIKSKNIDRVLDLMSLYEKNGFLYTPIMLAQSIALFTAAADLQKSNEIFSKLKKDFPSFRLDINKVFDYAALLTKYTKLDETVSVLKYCLTEPYIIGNADIALKSIKRFFAAAADTRDVEFVKNIQNIIMPLSKILGSKKFFLEPLINVLLHEKDLTFAFEEFRNFLIKYRMPVGLNNLLKKCINIGDKTTLQKVIDITTNYAGKNVALLELAVAFIETDHPEKAFKLVQSLGWEADPDVVEEICLTLYSQNKLAELEKFIHAAKALPRIDKEKLYCHLLKLCAVRNDCKKALDVFHKLKLVTEPSSKAINILIDLLRKNNQPIPTSILLQATSDTDIPASGPKLMNATENFIKYLGEGDVKLVLNELKGLKKGYIQSLSSQSLSDLVNLCLKKSCLADLSYNVHAMSYIIENSKEILKPILINCSAAGEVENLIAIANYFPDFSLRNIGFNSYFANAFISAGKPENLLSELEERYYRKNKLFSVVAFEELLKFPDLEGRVLNLAQKYHEANFDLPIAVIWAYYFTLENYQKADEVFKLCSKMNVFNIDNLIGSKILRSIRQKQSVSMGEKYISFINQVNPRLSVKTAAYGTLLDILVLKGNYNDAVDLVLESEKLQLLLHKHYRSTLITLKNILEKEKKPVPFNLPDENFESTSSSGSERYV